MQDHNLKADFIAAMRCVVSTVYVISAKSIVEKHAMTAISVTSLSMSPPSILVCVNKEASIHNLLSKDSLFCVNILSREQESLSKVCSESEEGESRFHDPAWIEDKDYVFNSNSLSNIFCKCIDTIDHTSHTIFIAEVKATQNNESFEPLIYQSGNYLK